jgi:hypothetical protein
VEKLLDRDSWQWGTFSREQQARRLKDAIVAKERARRQAYRWNRVAALSVDRTPKVEVFATASGHLAYKLKRDEGSVSVPYVSILAT